MKYKDNTESQNGDVIRWNCNDADEMTTWSFTGLVTPAGVVYLGGGIDFGMGIGQILSPESVVEESEQNDPNERGIEKVGVAGNLAIHVGRFGKA